MNNPITVEVPKGGWVPLVSNVTSGWVHKKKKSDKIFVTFRLHGEASPTDIREGVEADMHNEIKSENPIDVYAFCLLNDCLMSVWRG